MIKSLSELALHITEEEYRSLPMLSYNTMARYEKGGFASIQHLFDPIEGEALTFGSVVDTLITQGAEEFENRFVIIEIEKPTDALLPIVDYILCNSANETMEEVPDSLILDACNLNTYCSRMSDQVRIDRVREACTKYYNDKKLSEGKTIISRKLYDEAYKTVVTLKTNPVTAKYLKETQEGSNIEFLYQQKFSTVLNGLEVKMMADLLIVNHDKKVIIPIDLKTTSIPEYDFPKKFIEHRYDIQSRLYCRILRTIMSADDYFKDFTLCYFTFLVINKDRLLPMLFKDERSLNTGNFELAFNSGYKKLLRDPEEIGKELKHYLDTNAVVPDDLDTTQPIKIYDRIMNT